MKFVCERCHTKYSIADEKVRGKVLKVRCKSCDNVITVRETGASVDDPPASGAPRAAPPASASRSGNIRSPAAPTPAPAPAVPGPAVVVAGAKVAPLPAVALSAPGSPAAPPPRRAIPTPSAPPPPVDDGIEWYLAVDGNQTGPFARAKLVEKILAQPKEADVHVWNGGLDGWKPPKDVPAVQADLARRRRTPTPVPPPPPIPGPARRPSPAAVPLAAAGARTSGATVTPAPVAGGEPGLAPAARISRPHPVQKSPLPEPKRNGVTAAHAAAAAVPALGPDDGLAGLNLGSGRAAMADVALSARPVVLERSAGTAAAMEAASVRPGRARQTKLVLGAVALVVVVCGIVGISMLKRPAGDTTTSPGSTPSPTTGTADFAAMAAKLAEEEAAAKAKLAAEKAKEAPKAPGEAPADPGAGAARADLHRQPGKRHGKKQPALPPPTSPPPLGTTPPVRLTAAQQAEANRFGGESAQRDVRVPTSSGGVGRSSPAQADISRVISNNKQGIQTCYQRALLRDNSLTHGKINVRVVISVSGKVRNVSLDAPQSFRALEPCIRDVMSRWAFPPSSEEYSTEFPVVLQGNQ